VEKKNVYVRAQEIVRELPPVLERVRKHDKKLADQRTKWRNSMRGSTACARSLGA